MSDEINRGVAELQATYEFCMSVSALPSDDFVKRIETRDPEYLSHLKTMDEQPANIVELWIGFCVWSISCLKKKYESIWDEVRKAYFSSDARKQPKQTNFPNLIWKQLEDGF